VRGVDCTRNFGVKVWDRFSTDVRQRRPRICLRLWLVVHIATLNEPAHGVIGFGHFIEGEAQGRDLRDLLG
jgi:hypothetical protein